MSNKSKTGKLSFTLRGFGGIDTRFAHSDPHYAQNSLNFRIRKDGSLQKRCGYRFLADLGATPRAEWVGDRHGVATGYFLIGKQVVRMNMESGETLTLGPVSTESGNAFFFFYEGVLYLSDGLNLYELSGEVPKIVIPYVPLIGKDWNNREVGEPYEPINILTRRVRISYVVSDPPTIFFLVPALVYTVDAVYVNDEPISSDRYTWDTRFNTVNVTEVNAYDRVVLYLTLAGENHPLLSEFHSSSQAVVFDGSGNSRLFFLNRNASSTLLCSSYVPKEDLAEAKKGYPSACGLYLPEGYAFAAGDKHRSVQSIERYYERLLIFTEGDVWMTPQSASGKDEFPCTLVNATTGCSAIGGSTVMGSSPVSLGHYALWQWSGDAEREGELTAKRISEPIESMLSPEDYQDARIFYHRQHDELWLHLPTRGDIFVYHCALDAWVRFNGIDADRFFDTETIFGFRKDGRIYLFDASLSHDYPSETEKKRIPVEYRSGFSDFGTVRRKNLASIALTGDFGGSVVVVNMVGNATPFAHYVFLGDHSHAVYRTRCSSPRVSHIAFYIYSVDDHPLIIHSAQASTR